MIMLRSSSDVEQTAVSSANNNSRIVVFQFMFLHLTLEILAGPGTGPMDPERVH